MEKKAVVVSFMTLKLLDTSEYAMNVGRCATTNNSTLHPIFRYVGLCASIKLVALAIFAVDWWLVRRRKQLEYPSPLSTNPAVGSIISLDKRMFANA